MTLTRRDLIVGLTAAIAAAGKLPEFAAERAKLNEPLLALPQEMTFNVGDVFTIQTLPYTFVVTSAGTSDNESSSTTFRILSDQELRRWEGPGHPFVEAL